MVTIRRAATRELTGVEIAALRRLVWAAFDADDAYAGDEGFGEDDWDHALGGTHVLLEEDGRTLAHAAVVERSIEIDGRPFRAGYVEAVATGVDAQGRGHGSAVMREVNDLIRTGFELGVLGTGRHAFYQRLGWERWHGPSAVRTPDGVKPTPDDDDGLMVLRTAVSHDIDLGVTISCDWRAGDVW